MISRGSSHQGIIFPSASIPQRGRLFRCVYHNGEDYSAVYPTSGKIIPLYIPHRGRLFLCWSHNEEDFFRCVSHNREDYSAVYPTAGKIIPLCITQQGKIIPRNIPQHGINIFVEYLLEFSRVKKWNMVISKFDLKLAQWLIDSLEGDLSNDGTA